MQMKLLGFIGVDFNITDLIDHIFCILQIAEKKMGI
jgi:hypothetical protein